MDLLAAAAAESLDALNADPLAAAPVVAGPLVLATAMCHPLEGRPKRPLEEAQLPALRAVRRL